jgi:hypothetical protein
VCKLRHCVIKASENAILLFREYFDLPVLVSVACEGWDETGLVDSVAGCDVLSFLALYVVSVYCYVNVAWSYLFKSACFIKPDSCVVFVQFRFDVLILIYLCCLF